MIFMKILKNTIQIERKILIAIGKITAYIIKNKKFFSCFNYTVLFFSTKKYQTKL